MGIDGIRRSSPPANFPASSDEVKGSPETGRPFEPQRAASVAAEPLQGPLAAVQRGAADVNGYIDLKVDEATAHLVGLPASDLLSIRAAIRDRLANDPTLVDLVWKAAGGLARAPEDE